MFKKAILIVVLFCLCSSLFATLDMSNAEPYGEDEFPKWSLDIRRAEIIFFGAIPIAFPITGLIGNAFNKDLSFGEQLGISVSVAAGIALTDFIIGIINKK